MEDFDLDSLDGMSAPEMTSMLKDIGDGSMGQGIANLYIFETEPDQACDIKSLVLGIVIGIVVGTGVTVGIVHRKKKRAQKETPSNMEPEKVLVKAESSETTESEE